MVFDKVEFPIYGIIIMLSIILGIVYIYRELKSNNINDKNIFLYFLMLISFSIVFGKIFTLLTSPSDGNILTVGLSSYGGLVGLVLSSYIFEKIVYMNNKLIKVSIISLPLIYSISKIACFIVGCCYGIPYDGLFSVTYSHGLNISLFPVQLVETIVFMIIFVFCHKLRDNKYIIYITLVLCVILKFLLDFFRYDHITKILTVNQIFSIILLVIILIIFILKKRK